VAVCRWLYDVLALNGVPRERLVYCPQGVERPEPGIPTIVAAGDSARHPLRIGFLGRWEHVKGVHILVDAVRRLPAAAPVEVVIHGLPFDADYERAVRQRAAGDPRIVFKPPLPRADVLRSLARFDVLAVPSIWLETGPLVVLEALSVGTPILGSNLGGISEIVEPGVHGTLVGPGDVIAWSNAIRALTISPPARVAPLGAALRSWDLIADDMVETYEAVAAARATATVS
jgi:glycosyltransferase involved in cell wall biosynthesis